MTSSTPAATAAWNGARSSRNKAASGLSTCGISRWLSAAVSPWPGKCLAQATMPPAWAPATAAATCMATRLGTSPKERVSMIGESQFRLTSAQGPSTQLKPALRISTPNTWYIAAVSVVLSALPSARLPGPVVDSGVSTLQAPSWSTPSSSGGAERRCAAMAASAAVSARASAKLAALSWLR